MDENWGYTPISGNLGMTIRKSQFSRDTLGVHFWSQLGPKEESPDTPPTPRDVGAKPHVGHPNNTPKQYHLLVTRGWTKRLAIRSEFDSRFQDLGFEGFRVSGLMLGWPCTGIWACQRSCGIGEQTSPGFHLGTPALGTRLAGQWWKSLPMHPALLLQALPSGKLTFCYGKSPFSMGKSTISMAIFNSYVKLPEAINGK